MHGIALLHKPAGVTSFQALGALKKLLGTGRVGHAGTLDKFASGLLIVAVGAATRLLRFFMAEEKEYRAEIVFGTGTDTLDPEGVVTGTGPVPARDELERALDGFRGEILQRPPVFSAVHVDGERAWRAALRGDDVNLPPRPVRISLLEMESYEPPRAAVRVVCSRGTYIRALARDLAGALGTCGHLSALRRVRIGGFFLEDATPPEAFDPALHLLPAGRAVERLSGMTVIRVASGGVAHLRSGRAPDKAPLDRPPAQGLNAVLDDGGELVAVVERRDKDIHYVMVVPVT